MATKNPSLRSTLRKYGENTSAHGIPRAVTTKSFVRRLFWTCLFLASLSYFLYQAQTLVYKYIKYPVTTDVTIQWSALQFPAVTICNANPLRYRQLVRLGSAEFESAGFIPKPANPPQNGSAPSTTQAPTTLANDDDDYDYDAFHGDFETINSFTGLLVQLNDSMKQSLGHQARDLIQECQFDGRPCSFRNFTLFTDSTYGNCFTFNKEEFIPGRSPHSVTSAGPSHGLSLILYIEQEEYIPRIAEKAGVRVVIHSNEVFPFPEAEGFDAPPGSLTSAGLRLTHITRLGGKYGDCTDGAGHELLYPGGYTQQNCIATCHQDHMISICGCADISYMLPQGATYCNSSTSVATCEEGVKRRIATANLTCACPASCSDRVFRKSIGLAEWPADSYLPTVLSKLRTKSRGPGTGILGDLDQFKRNLLKVNIYYEALNFERITETPGYEVENLLGDLGGQLGLWVGMSCLSAMEIMEVLADIVVILWKKLSSGGRPTSPKVTNVVDMAGTDRNDTYNAHTAGIRVAEKM